MDLIKKIRHALSKSLNAEYVRLYGEDGISGFIVSPIFKGVSALDRQKKIDDVLGAPGNLITADERRRILMIAGLTPVEYLAAGSRVRIHKLRELAGHSIEVVLHGTLSDADYARELFDQTEGVQTTLPKQLSGAPGYSFRAKGTPDLPLTRDRALHILEKDQYVVLLPNAYSERLP